MKIAVDVEYQEDGRKKIMRVFGPVNVGDLATIARFGSEESDTVQLGMFFTDMPLMFKLRVVDDG